MAGNKRYLKGERLYLPVSAGTVSGSPVIVGNRGGVALIDRDTNNSATVDLKGVYNLMVTGAINNVGEAVYIADDVNPDLRLNSDGTARQFFGYALETKAAGAALTDVLVGEASGISAVGVGDIVTAMLDDDVLSADAAGRGKTEDGYFDEATVLAKFAADSLSAANLAAIVEDDAITQAVALAKIAADALDAAVLANAVEDDAFTQAVVLAKFAADSLDDAVLANAVEDDAFTAAVVAAKFATDSLTTAILNDIVVADAIDATVVAAKFGTDSFDAANFADVVEDGAIGEVKLSDPAVDGLHAVRVARATFDPENVVGERAQGTHGLGVTIPANAIIIRGVIEVTTAFTDAAAASVTSFQAEAAEDLLADTGVASLGVGLVDVVPVSTAATAVQTTIARELSARVAGADLTGGTAVVFVEYYVSE